MVMRKGLQTKGVRGDVKASLALKTMDTSLYVQDAMSLSDCRDDRILLSEYWCDIQRDHI